MTLSHVLIDRLSADAKAREFEILVLAALEGPAALRQALSDGREAGRPASVEPTPKDPAGAYLRSISVEGFRGVGPKARLELPPGPGLTLVVGRNGSGKSSFAEGLELLLTGDTYRWSKRTKVWREGWRSLHHGTAAIEAELYLEGERGAAVVAARWQDGAELGDATTSVQVHGKPRAGLDSLGWKAPLVTYRPFLSYNELGSLLDTGPSALFDALSQILGLEELVAAQEALADERKGREKELKDTGARRELLQTELAAIADPRAVALRDAIAAKDWGLDAAEQIVAGQSESPARAEVDVLRRLTQLQAPDAAAVAAARAGLLEANAKAKQAAGTLAGRAKDLAEVLDHALRFHETHGDGDCPVCGRPAALNQEWRGATQDQVASLRASAREAVAAQAGVEAALKAARQLRGTSVEALARTTLPEGLQALSEPLARARQEAERWLAILEEADLEALAGRLDGGLRPLAEAMDALRTLAEAELRAREDAWRPVADKVRLWLAAARGARKASEPVKPLKAAETWLKQAAEDLRNERFAPIKEKAQAIWNQLRMQSNVSLENIRLAGSANRRQVELDVTVDGVAGAALGVMSQGELHALALSLFIPRATLPESPFRFVVIDDPVQSMDPSRVDGLARVLQGVARERQVIVFTHDDRLPEAARRLDVEATVIEVTRRGNSVVELKAGQDPVSRYIADAIALAASHDGIPPQAVRRVVPVICRSAIEAACAETARRRRLGDGRPHAEVEALIDGLKGTRQFAALALFDDPERTADVMARLNSVRRQHADTFRLLNEGAHELQQVPIFDLVKEAERLALYLQGLK